MSSVKPYFSLAIIIFSLLIVVFSKMEVRRLGYVVLKSSSEAKKMEDTLRGLKLSYAYKTRPEVLQKIAKQKMTYFENHEEQIIQITGNKIALKR